MEPNQPRWTFPDPEPPEEENWTFSQWVSKLTVGTFLWCVLAFCLGAILASFACGSWLVIDFFLREVVAK